jgi:CheY-like chemotaxis protein/predicted Fe-Mo cluster-binding NifX family protein
MPLQNNKQGFRSMVKVAIPIFRSRVAPVFDYCVRVSVFDIGDDDQIERSELYLGTLAPTERVGALIKEGVTTLVCSGISDALDKMLQTSGISVIGGIVGSVEEVLEAFMSDRIDEPQYCMPGIGGQGHAPPQDRSEPVPHVGSLSSAQVSADRQPTRRPEPTQKKMGKARILLVENDLASRQSALHIFQKSGCEVDAVTNGREAIKALETETYDFVFMDALMSEMDGYEATKVIRNPQSGVRCHDVPVIAMTGHAREKARKRCLEAGMDHCISKPIKPKRLREIINIFPPDSHSDA